MIDISLLTLYCLVGNFTRWLKVIYFGFYYELIEQFIECSLDSLWRSSAKGDLLVDFFFGIYFVQSSLPSLALTSFLLCWRLPSKCKLSNLALDLLKIFGFYGTFSIVCCVYTHLTCYRRSFGLLLLDSLTHDWWSVSFKWGKCLFLNSRVLILTFPLRRGLGIRSTLQCYFISDWWGLRYENLMFLTDFESLSNITESRQLFIFVWTELRVIVKECPDFLRLHTAKHTLTYRHSYSDNTDNYVLVPHECPEISSPSSGWS